MRYFILSSICLLTAAGAFAQIYNTGILYIGNGNTLYSGGGFTNTSGADYKNDGILYIGGNATNDQPTLPAGGGNTWFNGLTPQTLGGAAPFRSFNVTMNNPSGLTLSNRLAIGDGTGGTLTFTAGLIGSGTNTQDVYFYPGSGYAGFDAGHHIIGYATKSGNTNFTFPIGDGTHQADLDLSSLSASGDFQVLYHGAGYGTYNVTGALAPGGVFDKEWWEILRTAGAATAKVSLKWNDVRKSLNHSSPAGLVIAHFTGGAWQSEGGATGAGAGSSTGTIGPSNSLSSFSPFTFGSTTVPLPILLGSFTGMEKDCQASLQWVTTLEENARGFLIEQSLDGSSFAAAGFVPAKGMPSDYGITLSQPVQEAFYRIKEEDLDGHFIYSPIIGVRLNCILNAETFSVYPNPVTRGGAVSAKFVAAAARGTAQMQVFDMSGRLIYSQIVQVKAGINLYPVPAAGLVSGVYTLLITGDGWKTPGVQVVKNE